MQVQAPSARMTPRIRGRGVVANASTSVSLLRSTTLHRVLTESFNPAHSARSASVGEIPAARSAGTMAANSALSPSDTTATASAPGSQLFTP